jgi:cytochrome c553
MQPRTFSIAAVTAVIGLVTVVAGALVVGWFGWYDVSARSGHPVPVAWALHWFMRQSVAHNAPNRPVPDLSDPRLILRGATHFAGGCAPCHGAPGQLASPIAKEMLPVPPGLYDAAAQFSPSELYWIIRDGIKITAMPGWPAPSREDEIWAMVAFLEQLPALKTADYIALSGRNGAGEFLPQGEPQGFDPRVCARCHGARGQGRRQAFPNIAGLSAGYIAAQLRDFHDGTRRSGFMQPVAAALNDDAILAAATYFSGLPRGAATAPATTPDLLAEGEAVVKDGTPAKSLPACNTCHLPPGGPDPAVPVITGQPPDYTLTQLQLFATGARSGTPAAEAMGRVARAMSEEQMKAVAVYLAGVK